MNTGIATEHLEKICDLLRGHAVIRDAILYGSRAKGTYQPGSDIDIALKGADVDSRIVAQIDTAYQALYLPWALDLRRYEDIESVDLKAHIDRVGISLLR